MFRIDVSLMFCQINVINTYYYDLRLGLGEDVFSCQCSTTPLRLFPHIEPHKCVRFREFCLKHNDLSPSSLSNASGATRCLPEPAAVFRRLHTSLSSLWDRIDHRQRAGTWGNLGELGGTFCDRPAFVRAHILAPYRRKQRVVSLEKYDLGFSIYFSPFDFH